MPSLIFLGLGLVCFGILIKVLMTRGHQQSSALPKTVIVPRVAPSSPAKSVVAAPKINQKSPSVPENTRIKFSTSQRIQKQQSFFLQAERKRLFWACLQLEKRPTSDWAAVLRALPELRETNHSSSTLFLAKQWELLSEVIYETTEPRGIASSSGDDRMKIRKLREKFFQK